MRETSKRRSRSMGHEYTKTRQGATTIPDRKGFAKWVSCVAACAFLITGSAFAKDKKPAPPACKINVTILRDYSDKPIRNAAVVLHPVNDNGKQERGGLELKTDPEGHATYDGLPYGKLRVQVLANGFQTFGQDYDVSQPTMELTIKLKRPGEQYSIYQDHPAQEQTKPAPDPSKPAADPSHP